MLVVVTNTPSPDLPRPRWSDLMDRSLWVIISFQAEPVLSIRTHTRAYTNATGLTCGLPDDARRSSSSGHPYVSIYGNISASVFMHTRVRVIAGTRVFTRREIKYANLRAWASLLASVSDTRTFSSVGLEHMEGFVATLIASQIMNFQVFSLESLSFLLGKKGKRRGYFTNDRTKLDIGGKEAAWEIPDQLINTVRWEEVIASGVKSRKILDFNRAWYSP